VSQQNSAVQRSEDLAQKIRNNQVKDLLGRALAAANAISVESNNLSDDQLELKAREWATYTRNLIKAAYGDSEAELFLDNSGYTFIATVGRSQKRNNIGAFMDGRTRRLTELLRRADTLTVRSEFEPAKFEAIP
jgi:hypothetical protein